VWRGPLLLGALVLAGCVTLTSAQQEKLDDWRAFADRVTAHYKTSRVTFLIGAHGGFEAASMRPGGLMTVTPEALDPGKRTDFMLAHELAHWVLGHLDGRTYSSTLERRRASQAKEMAANAEAVPILVLARGGSERDAFVQAQAYLWGWKNLVERGGTGIPEGHAEPCEEIADLIRRFPQHATVSRPCPA
jgi:hypothetical protein